MPAVNRSSLAALLASSFHDTQHITWSAILHACVRAIASNHAKVFRRLPAAEWR